MVSPNPRAIGRGQNLDRRYRLWNELHQPEPRAEIRFTPIGLSTYTDNDGYLFIVDRKKEIIIRGGENISCIEVEQALYAHPDIAEASVFGLPDARLGEVPVAVVFAKPGHVIDFEELRTFVAGQIAPFKVPVRIWHESEPLPRLGTEKVDKRALKARYADQGTGATDKR